jgi:hypothetical protein
VKKSSCHHFGNVLTLTGFGCESAYRPAVV